VSYCDRVAVATVRLKNQEPADGVQIARHGAASMAHDGFDGIQLLSQVCAGTKFVVHEDRPKRIYSLKRKATADGRLIMTGRSTSFEVSAPLQVG
jgi:hypothetical protein